MPLFFGRLRSLWSCALSLFCFQCFLILFIISLPKHHLSTTSASLHHVPRLRSRHHVLVPMSLQLQLVLAHHGHAAVACDFREIVVVVRIASKIASTRHRIGNLDVILRRAALAEKHKGDGDKQDQGSHSDACTNAGFST